MWFLLDFEFYTRVRNSITSGSGVALVGGMARGGRLGENKMRTIDIKKGQIS